MAIVLIVLSVVGFLIFLSWYNNTIRKKVEPEPFLKTGHQVDSRCVCQVCGHYIGLKQDCPYCEHEYRNDILGGVFPPSINESNKEYYFLLDWQALRKIDIKRDRRIKEDGVSPEIAEADAIRERDDYIRNHVLKRIAKDRASRPQTTEEINGKRCAHYAGASQYSGIILPK